MTGVVVVNAARLLRRTLRPLLDESLPAEERAVVQGVLNADARVRGYHRLRTRQAGSRRLMDVHILLDDNLTFRAAHTVGEEVEHAIRRALPNVDVTVHAEPFEEEIHHQQEYQGLPLSSVGQTGPGHPRDALAGQITQRSAFSDQLTASARSRSRSKTSLSKLIADR